MRGGDEDEFEKLFAEGGAVVFRSDIDVLATKLIKAPRLGLLGCAVTGLENLDADYARNITVACIPATGEGGCRIDLGNHPDRRP